MFSYYGSKSKIAKHYPEPIYDLIIEPFAGAAHYSMLYPSRKVILNDIDARVIAIWQFLINASAEDVLSLPNVYAGLRFDSIENISDAERDLTRFCTNRGEGNKNVASSYGVLSWRSKREKMAKQIELVRHWQIINGEYDCLDNVEATWFIDSPYENKQGRKYKFNNLDYEKLAAWCLSRKGQVIVCENENSKHWLPFEPLRSFRGIGKTNTEVVYVQS
jgi:site-specific DNA-adenine methylase